MIRSSLVQVDNQKVKDAFINITHQYLKICIYLDLVNNIIDTDDILGNYIIIFIYMIKLKKEANF